MLDRILGVRRRCAFRPSRGRTPKLCRRRRRAPGALRTTPVDRCAAWRQWSRAASRSTGARASRSRCPSAQISVAPRRRGGRRSMGPGPRRARTRRASRGSAPERALHDCRTGPWLPKRVTQQGPGTLLATKGDCTWPSACQRATGAPFLAQVLQPHIQNTYAACCCTTTLCTRSGLGLRPAKREREPEPPSTEIVSRSSGCGARPERCCGVRGWDEDCGNEGGMGGVPAAFAREGHLPNVVYVRAFDDYRRTLGKPMGQQWCWRMCRRNSSAYASCAASAGTKTHLPALRTRNNALAHSTSALGIARNCLRTRSTATLSSAKLVSSCSAMLSARSASIHTHTHMVRYPARLGCR